MNKDVIYIEPEDDITDIIAKIEKTKEKIVALVPPKKAGVFRSVVNIKLIAKSGAGLEKTIVLVTTDPSIIKLAAATQLPVTKDLQTAPVIPTDESLEQAKKDEQVIEATDNQAEPKPEPEEAKPDEDKKKENEKDEENKEKEKTKSKNKFVNWIKNHKKTAIFGGIAAVVLIAVLIWMFAIAPAATVTVGIRTTENNFSENVTFTTTAADEDAQKGKFLLTENKTETAQKVTFTATGTKNKGNKASGSLTIYTYFKTVGTTTVSAGSSFSIDGLTFYAAESVTLSWDGESTCDNDAQKTDLVNNGCRISGKINVTAAEAGAKYNVSGASVSWNPSASISAYANSAMAGGTDNIVTVVEQADVNKAKASLETADEDANKVKLLETLEDDVMVIESSYSQKTGNETVTPGVGEEVANGVTPTLTATTIASVYTIDKTKVEEFIKEKANIGDDLKIYEIKNAYVENFTTSGGKLKATYVTGPRFTEDEMVQRILGKGFGDAQHELRNIDGVSTVEIQGSYPWVSSIPNDTNKVTVIIENAE